MAATVMTYTETCARCGRAEEVRSTAESDHWSLGPDGWVAIMVDWDGFLASRPGDGFDLVVLHVCPACVTEEDQDTPHMSWRLKSGDQRGRGLDGRGRA